MSLHYSAIPERDPETFAGEKWYAENSSRYSSMARWKKEQEMDPYATGGEAVFGSVLGNEALYQVVVISDPNWYPGPPYMAANPDVVGGFDHGVTNATCLLKGYVPKETIDPTTGRKNPPELYLAGEFYRYRSDDWQNNVDENVKVMKKMPDIERARWIKADPSIFYDAVAQDKGAPTNIYQTYKKNNMWRMTPYDGVRSDVTFVEWVMADWWKGISTLEGKPTGVKPRLYIVCRTPSDRPQPGLHEFDCPNLVWEMKRAKRVQMTSRQLETRNPSEALQNKNNHAMDCLSLGTLIIARRGDVPIERIVAGDEVLTRGGWRKVQHSWLANPASEVYRVKFSNGTEIIGTAGHRFFIESIGFIKLDKLKCGMVCLCETKGFAEKQRRSSGWESISTDTQRASTARIDITQTGAFGFTSSCGFLRTIAQFLKDAIFTIWMETSPTITQRTLRPSKLASIFASTRSATIMHERPLNGLPILQRSGKRQRAGTPVWKERRGTARTLAGRFILSAIRFVANAANNFKIRTLARETRSVLATAGNCSITQMDATRKQSPASNAEKCSSASDQLSNPASPSSVAALASVVITQIQRLPGVRPTYDLTIEGEHEFFANGILVHNCCKQILGTLRNSSAIDPNVALAEAIENLDPFASQLTSRWMMSDLARKGKLGPDGKVRANGKGCVRVDLSRSRGPLG
jgi:hypothetical protein